MSFRLYPTFVKGNPQLRIFLPNFWMKLVKPKIPTPPNSAQFIVPLEMSDVDVKNYLEKIYKVPVTEVRTRVFSGEIKKTHKGYLIKDDDYRVAFVTLGPGQTFEFPELFAAQAVKKEKEVQAELVKQEEDLKKQKSRSWNRADVPSWFSI